MRLMLFAAMAGLIVVAIGYYVFLDRVHDLAANRDPMRADGIVVLTGGHNRLETASALMKNGKASRLLVSGVNTDLGREELQGALNLDKALFDCCVDIDYVALDTVGNAEQGHEWAKRNGYTSLIVVTNDYHMPRSLVEMHRINDQLEIIPHSVINPPEPGETIGRKLDRHRVLTQEYAKYILSLGRLVLPHPAGNADQPATASMQTGW